MNPLQICTRTPQPNTNVNPHFSQNPTSTCVFLSPWDLNAQTTKRAGLGVEQSAVMADVTCSRVFTPVITSGPQLSVCHLSGEGRQRAARAQWTYRSADKQRARANTTQPRDPPLPPFATLRDPLISTCLQYSALKLIGTLTSPSAAGSSTSLALRTRVTSHLMEGCTRVIPKAFIF